MTREEAIKIINELWGVDYHYCLDPQGIEAVDKAIKALKYDRGQYEKGYADAKAEQKRGKWLSHYEYCKRKGCTPSGLIAFWWCDQCEREARYRTYFCPNCGAKMEEEE